jgi:hypothetical protein
VVIVCGWDDGSGGILLTESCVCHAQSGLELRYVNPRTSELKACFLWTHSVVMGHVSRWVCWQEIPGDPNYAVTVKFHATKLVSAPKYIQSDTLRR